MKKTITLSILLAIFLAVPHYGNVVVIPEPPQYSQDSIFNASTGALIKYDRKKIEAKIGRKLKFTEKLALWLVKRKFKKNSGKRLVRDPKTLAITGFVISTTGLISTLVAFLTFMPFFLIVGVFCIIFGVIVSKTALDRIIWEDEMERGKGFAQAGIWLAAFTVLLFLILGNIAFG